MVVAGEIVFLSRIHFPRFEIRLFLLARIYTIREVEKWIARMSWAFLRRFDISQFSHDNLISNLRAHGPRVRR